MQTALKKINGLTLRLWFSKIKIPLFSALLLQAGVAIGQVNVSNPTPIRVVNPTSLSNFGELINKIVNFAITFAGAIAVIYLIYAGFNYITSQGNPKKVAAAKQGIFAGLIGVAIVLIAWILVDLIMNQLIGVHSEYGWTEA